MWPKLVTKNALRRLLLNWNETHFLIRLKKGLFYEAAPVEWNSHSFRLIFRGSGSFGEQRYWTIFPQEKRKKKFRVFLTWHGDIVDTENGRNIFLGSYDLWIFRHQNINTKRTLWYISNKRGMFCLSDEPLAIEMCEHVPMLAQY